MRPFTPLNHYGVMVELENFQRFVIHSSPNNLGEGGHEIVISENSLTSKWETFTDWFPVHSHLTIGELMEPTTYKMWSNNCIHSVKRIWGRLLPGNYFNYWVDPIVLKIWTT